MPLLLKQHDPRSLLRGFRRSDTALRPPQWFEGVEVPPSYRERHVFAPPPPPPPSLPAVPRLCRRRSQLEDGERDGEDDLAEVMKSTTRVLEVLVLYYYYIVTVHVPGNMQVGRM